MVLSALLQHDVTEREAEAMVLSALLQRKETAREAETMLLRASCVGSDCERVRVVGNHSVLTPTLLPLQRHIGRHHSVVQSRATA